MGNSDSGEGCLILVVMVFCCVGLFFYTDFSAEKEIKTEKKIEPTIELTTDGKTVDTVYIYRKDGR